MQARHCSLWTHPKMVLGGRVWARGWLLTVAPKGRIRASSAAGSPLLLLGGPRGFPAEPLCSRCLSLSSPFTLTLFFWLPSLILSQRGHKPLIKGERLLFIIQPSPGFQCHNALPYFPYTLFISWFNTGKAKVNLKDV